MARPKIPSAVQVQVLAECRRRCALCFALNNDISAKVNGQIAHIDRNSQHNEPENLAWLCLEHANLYDVVAKQSKGFLPGELRCYKADLALVLRAVHDPRHIQRIIANEYRRSAAKVGKKQRQPRKKSARRKKED